MTAGDLSPDKLLGAVDSFRIRAGIFCIHRINPGECHVAGDGGENMTDDELSRRGSMSRIRRWH